MGYSRVNIGSAFRIALFVTCVFTETFIGISLNFDTKKKVLYVLHIPFHNNNIFGDKRNK